MTDIKCAGLLLIFCLRLFWKPVFKKRGKKNRRFNISFLILPVLLLLLLAETAPAEVNSQISKPPTLLHGKIIPLTIAEKNWLKQGRTIRVRVGHAPPFMFTDGEIRGIAIDYITAVFRHHGISFRFIDNTQVTWLKALEYIKKHEVIDLLPTAKITEERKKFMMFTNEYIAAPWVIFTRIDADFISTINDLNGKTVSVEEGYVMHEKLKNEYPKIRLKVVPTHLKKYSENPIEDLATGRADAYIGNLLSATYILQAKGYTNIKVAAPTPFGNHNQAMGIRNDWPELAGIINKSLAAMTPAEHAGIRNKWVNVRFEYGISPADIIKWMLIIFVFIIFFVLFFLFWNRRLQSEIKYRKKIENMLRSREELLNDVGKIAKIGGWEVDLSANTASWTCGTYDIVELDHTLPVPGPDEQESYFLEKYRPLVTDAVAALIKKNIPMKLEAQFRTAKGNIRWCHAEGRSLRKGGRCIKIYGTVQDISEKKQSEITLKERESLFEKIFNILPVGLWITDKKGKLLRGNPEGIGIWGAEPNVDPSEYGIFRAWRLPSGEEVAPDDWALYHTITKGVTVVDEMLEIDAFDGFRKVVLNYTAPVLNEHGEIQAAIVVNQDITERKKSEDALRESEHRHRVIFEKSPLGIIRFDSEGTMIDFNDKFVELMGTSREKLIGFNTARQSTPKMQQAVSKALAGKEAAFEDWYTSITGDKTIFLRVVFNPVNPDAPPTEVIATLEDFTERKKNEEEKEKLQEQLIQARKMESIGTLSGGIAHEFNNILSIILGNSELALDDTPEWHPSHSFLAEIKAGSLRGKEIVRQLLSFTRKSGWKKQILNIVDIVRDSAEYLKSSIPETIHFEKHIDKTCSRILGDRTQLHQVMINLCNNAVQAMTENGGMLSIHLENVIADAPLYSYDQRLEPGKYVRLTISDTGQGISEEIYNHIFDPFYTTKDVNEGSGMGLSVVYGIIKNHNGFIKVDTRPGKGTDVSCYFPMATEPPPEFPPLDNVT